MYAAGPDLVFEWAQEDVDQEAFTPGDYQARMESRGALHRSVYVLDKSKG